MSYRELSFGYLNLDPKIIMIIMLIMKRTNIIPPQLPMPIRSKYVVDPFNAHLLTNMSVANLNILLDIMLTVSKGLIQF